MIRLYSKGSKNFQTVANSPNQAKNITIGSLQPKVQGTALVFGREPHHSRRSIFPGLGQHPTGAAANRWSSRWFGNFTSIKTAGADTNKLGWVFPFESPTSGLWLWKRNLGNFRQSGDLSFPLPKRPRRLVVFLREAELYLVLRLCA